MPGTDAAGRTAVLVPDAGRTVGDDPLLHACALAYISDDLPTDAVFRVALGGRADHDDGWFSVSLDHAIWFHRPLRADDWHLQDFTCHGFADGRGLAIGHVFAPDGTHAATIAQEVLLRRRRGVTSPRARRSSSTRASPATPARPSHLIADELRAAGHDAVACPTTDVDYQALHEADLVVVGGWTDGLFFVGQRPGRAGRLRNLPGAGRQAGRVLRHLRPRRRQDAREAHRHRRGARRHRRGRHDDPARQARRGRRASFAARVDANVLTA